MLEFLSYNFTLVPVATNNLNDISNGNSSIWSSSASATSPSPVNRPRGVLGDLKLHKNDHVRNSNIDFANFANVFHDSAAPSTTDPFLDRSNNNNGKIESHEGDLFADFNDNFGAATANKNSKSAAAFDPFGVSVGNANGSSHHFPTATFDDDDDPFGDSLPQRAKDEANNNESLTPGKALSNGGRILDLKRGKGNQIKNNRASRPDQSAKYTADYSKNFDTDLEEVLKRSLFEQ